VDDAQVRLHARGAQTRRGLLGGQHGRGWAEAPVGDNRVRNQERI